MGKKRPTDSIARELALQYLYCHEMRRGGDGGFVAFTAAFPTARKTASRARRLVEGILLRASETDALIAAIAENWSLHRMSSVCRNILRIGAFELLFRPGVPFKVVIDEAVELAKRYEAPETGAFVNGILDTLATKYRAKEKDATGQVCRQEGPERQRC